MHFLSTCLSSLALALAIHSSPLLFASTPSALDIVGKHTIQFTQPAKHIPSTTSVDAPLLGNGFTGIALAGPPEKQIFYAARNDFWRLKSDHGKGFPAVLGKIELSIPALKGATFLVEQQLSSATTNTRFQKDGFTVSYKAFVAATEDVLVCEITLEGKDELQGSARILPPGEKELNNPAFADKQKSGTTDAGIQFYSRAFEEDVDIPTKAAIALKIENSTDGNFTLTHGKPLRLICAFSSNFKSPNCVKTAVEKVSALNAASLSKIEDAHKQWWKNYWEKSYISIPDSGIEKQYYVSLYGTASCSRDKDFPPPIFGTWITKELPAWSGDYHLNYNHNAPFYALYSANRIEQAESYFPPVLAMMKRGNYYSEKVTNIPGGILLPVGIGPLGIETTRCPLDTSDSVAVSARRKAGNIEDEGMFWGQKSNSAYSVVNLSMQFYHTWDKEFAVKAYPYVKGVAWFWENYLKFEDGHYNIYNDSIHEGSIGSKNAILSLGLVQNLMQTVRDMSEFLGVDADKREKWEHIQTHLADYTYQVRKKKKVFRYTEKGAGWWNDNTLGIQHIYPAGRIDFSSPPELLEVSHNTIQVMQRWLDFNGSNSFFPAAVRIGFDPDTILHHLARYSKHTYPNGYQAGNPHGIENWSTVPNTINEMLCSAHQDVLRVFPVWPKNKDAFFKTIRTEGAFLVSSELENGKIGEVVIYSEKGRDLCFLNPWSAGEVRIKSSNGKEEKISKLSGEKIKLKTAAGTTYHFRLLKN